MCHDQHACDFKRHAAEAKTACSGTCQDVPLNEWQRRCVHHKDCMQPAPLRCAGAWASRHLTADCPTPGTCHAGTQPAPLHTCRTSLPVPQPSPFLPYASTAFSVPLDEVLQPAPAVNARPLTLATAVNAEPLSIQALTTNAHYRHSFASTFMLGVLGAATSGRCTGIACTLSSIR